MTRIEQYSRAQLFVDEVADHDINVCAGNLGARVSEYAPYESDVAFRAWLPISG